MLYIPKKYKKIVHDFYHDEDGYWLIVKEGWHVEDNARTVHQDTLKEVWKDLEENLERKC